MSDKAKEIMYKMMENKYPDFFFLEHGPTQFAGGRCCIGTYIKNNSPYFHKLGLFVSIFLSFLR